MSPRWASCLAKRMYGSTWFVESRNHIASMSPVTTNVHGPESFVEAWNCDTVVSVRKANVEMVWWPRHEYVSYTEMVIRLWFTVWLWWWKPCQWWWDGGGAQYNNGDGSECECDGTRIWEIGDGDGNLIPNVFGRQFENILASSWSFIFEAIRCTALSIAVLMNLRWSGGGLSLENGASL